MGGLGVGEDVELGRGGGVALDVRPAHGDDARDAPYQAGVDAQRQRQVGQRTNRDIDGLRTGRAVVVLQQELHRMFGLRLQIGRRQRQYGALVRVGRDVVIDQRLDRPGINRDGS